MSPTVLILSFSISNGMLFYAAINTTTQSLHGVDLRSCVTFFVGWQLLIFFLFFFGFFLNANDSLCNTQNFSKLKKNSAIFITDAVCFFSFSFSYSNVD